MHTTMVVITAPPNLSLPDGVDACRGTGVFGPLDEGDVVIVVDESGEELTRVLLGAGRRSGQADGCSWSAVVTLPTDRSSYRALIEGWGRSELLSLDDLYQPIVIEPGE